MAIKTAFHSLTPLFFHLSFALRGAVMTDFSKETTTLQHPAPAHRSRTHNHICCLHALTCIRAQATRMHPWYTGALRQSVRIMNKGMYQRGSLSATSADCTPRHFNITTWGVLSGLRMSTPSALMHAPQAQSQASFPCTLHTPMSRVHAHPQFHAPTATWCKPESRFRDADLVR